LLHDDSRTAQINALKIALEDAAYQARKLAEYNFQEFGEVFARAELAQQTMKTASQRYQHKVDNRYKMALVNELTALRRRRS